MKSFASKVACALFMLTLSGKALAMGQPAMVFEGADSAAIWDHGNEFYLRMDLAEIAGLKDQKFVWAGFQEEKPGVFTGTVGDSDNLKFAARAKLLDTTPSGRYFRIEILNEKGEVFKEIFIKAPAFAG